MTNRDFNVGLHFDLRNPQYDVRSHEEFTQEVIRLAQLAEELGFDSIWTAEHHFTSDGDCASPLLFSAALAARTTRIRIGTNLVVLPLHNPVRLAEDAAFLGVLSEGRFDLGVGAGYIPDDFAAFGQKVSHRPSLMEEGVSAIRDAWAGRSLERSGARWTLPDVTVSPLPRPVNEPKLYIGGVTEAAVRRAARLGDGFLCGVPAMADVYLDALEAEGRARTDGSMIMTTWWVIGADPATTWEAVGPHALYQVNKYIENGSWPDMEPFGSTAELLEREHFTLLDGPTAAQRLTELTQSYPQISDVHFYGLLPGEPVESGEARLRYIAAEVLPRLHRQA